MLELADVVPLAARRRASRRPDVPPTSWGAGRDLRTWSATELAWAQRSAELAALGAEPSPRALRELLALQSSDWAFLITHGTAGDYPRERAAGHHEAFTVGADWTNVPTNCGIWLHSWRAGPSSSPEAQVLRATVTMSGVSDVYSASPS